MKKIVRKTGTSLGIIFSKQDREIYDIEEGDIIDLDDFVVEKKKKKGAKSK